MSGLISGWMYEYALCISTALHFCVVYMLSLMFVACYLIFSYFLFYGRVSPKRRKLSAHWDW